MRGLVNMSAHRSGRLSGAELAEGLAANAFEAPGEMLRGMVKASAEPDHIGFTPAGCDEWIDIPVAMIASAEHVGHRSCRGHSHPLFAIAFAEPDDPRGRVLLSLLTSLARSESEAIVRSLIVEDGDVEDEGAMGILARRGPGTGGNGGWVCKDCHEVCVRWHYVSDNTSIGQHADRCEESITVCNGCKKRAA